MTARNRSRVHVAALALGVMSASCTARIDGKDGSRPPSDIGLVAAGGGSASGGSGATSDAGPGLDERVDPGATLMRRLTNAEYAHTVSDLLGEPPGADERLGFPEDPRSSGFDNDAEVETISNVHAERYSAAAENLANAVLASATRRQLVLGCEPSTDAACLHTFIERFGRRAYRRPLSADERSGDRQ